MGFSSAGYSNIHQSGSEGAAVEKQEETEHSAEAAKITGAGDGRPQSDERHTPTNLVEAVAHPSSQSVALDLDRMEFSSINPENTEAAPNILQKSNFVATPVLNPRKKENFLTPTSINLVKAEATNCNLGGTRGGPNDGSVVSSNSVGPSAQICDSEGTDPTVVNSPKKRNWKRLARINVTDLSMEEVKLGKRAISFETEENGQSRKRGEKYDDLLFDRRRLGSD
ncbi:hypothetical protein ACOSQ4_022149 [Xanthoceras sorbifolium]